MRYKCKICGFETDIKSQINIHHIIPREAGGTNAKWNLVQLCARCHSCIYTPKATKGIHSKCGINSIEIISWRESTSGKVLECKDMKTGEIYYI